MELRRASKLGGRAPRARREGRLVGKGLDRGPSPKMAPLLMVVLGCLIIGVISGFAWSMDRQLRGGLMAQRSEAIQRPDWVTLGQLPPYLAPAFLTVVDPEFGIRGARRGSFDDVSIPRELVREIHVLGNGFGGQAHERIMAPVLEQRMTDDQILELYLNRVHLGNSDRYPVYGIFNAAEEYFGKTAEALTVGETATLAGLLLPPRIDDPAARAGAVGVRRNEVLRALLREGTINQQQYSEAIAERLAFQPGLAAPPMTRILPTDQDTTVIRLPQEYLPQPQPDSTATP